MAQTTNQNILIEQAESSTAASILRNDDPLTQALRNGETLDLAEIARLNRVLSPIHDTSSPGTVSAEVFSDQDDSTTTKLTSTGAPYQDSNHYKGKGKAKASHASSLSVAYGSASEAEAQQHTIRRDALLEMGVWVQDDLISDMPLKDATRAKKRGHLKGRPKHKKPTVDVAQLATRHEKFNNTDPDSAVAITSARNHLEKSYLRKRATQHNENELRLAEEGQLHLAPTQFQSSRLLSRTRLYVVLLLIISIVLIIAFSAFGAHQTGKGRIACTKGIIFAATVLTSLLTVLAVIAARRSPQEALLAGLLEITIGFTLLDKLDDFM